MVKRDGTYRLKLDPGEIWLAHQDRQEWVNRSCSKGSRTE